MLADLLLGVLVIIIICIGIDNIIQSKRFKKLRIELDRAEDENRNKIHNNKLRNSLKSTDANRKKMSKIIKH